MVWSVPIFEATFSCIDFLVSSRIGTILLLRNLRLITYNVRVNFPDRRHFKANLDQLVDFLILVTWEALQALAGKPEELR